MAENPTGLSGLPRLSQLLLRHFSRRFTLVHGSQGSHYYCLHPLYSANCFREISFPLQAVSGWTHVIVRGRGVDQEIRSRAGVPLGQAETQSVT